MEGHYFLGRHGKFDYVHALRRRPGRALRKSKFATQLSRRFVALTGDVDAARGQPLVWSENPGRSEVCGICIRKSFGRWTPIVFLPGIRRQASEKGERPRKPHSERARRLSSLATSSRHAVTAP